MILKYLKKFLIIILLILVILFASLFFIFYFYDFLLKSDCFKVKSKPNNSLVEIYKVNNIPNTDSYLLVLSSLNTYKYTFHIRIDTKAIFVLGNYGENYKYIDYLVWYRDPADGDEYPITYNGNLLGDEVVGHKGDEYNFNGKYIYIKKYDSKTKKYLEISLKYICDK